MKSKRLYWETESCIKPSRHKTLLAAILKKEVSLHSYIQNNKLVYEVYFAYDTEDKYVSYFFFITT